MQLQPPFLLLFTLFNAVVFGFEAVNHARAFDLTVQSVVVVDKSGRGDFQTVQAAIDSVPPNNNQWIKIQINPGVYKEKVTIPPEKPFIYLEGADRSNTIITFDDHQQTDTSATFTSRPPNIIARGITFENSFNLEEAPELFVCDDGTYITQAIAARIYGDKSAFFNCGFKGYQDTLWDVQGRHFFQNCYIEGAIDFIFGSGQSVYKDCLINVNVASLPQVHQGFITAQGRRSAADPSGFVFKGCTITGSGKALLGRAYGPFSRVIFKDAIMGPVVAPEGWDAWNFKSKEKNFMYVEENCTGPGASTSTRVPWAKTLDASQLRRFSVESFINQDGWIPRLP
ncbi:putative pectinesterase 66 [Cucumis melo var. makuwa]|uniref:Pectinesterase n=1 Tax=Cucumis melo var. makuwa TaxID=1194695 RepID=A0A5A7U1G9_CUCMM|nr:putative pectinesterase 66 [Cucumis melo var. makuwa]